jgi:hypothetical protein
MKTPEEWIKEWRSRVLSNPENFSEILTNDLAKCEANFYSEIQQESRNAALDEAARLIQKRQHGERDAYCGDVQAILNLKTKA